MTEAEASGRWAFRRELGARWLLLLLALAPFALYLPRALLGPSAAELSSVGFPQSPAPSATHLLVLSVSTFDPGPQAGRLPGLNAWRTRSTNALGARPNADVPAGNAASLWTGRTAAHHGVQSAEVALPDGTWTLAEAARASGASTAAWLEAPFVGTNAVGGFTSVAERPLWETTPLLDELREFYAQRRERRTVVWVHLDRPEPARLDHLSGALLELLDETEVLGETLACLAIFTRDEAVPLEERRAVLWIAPPEVGWGTRKSPSPTNFSDATGALRELLRLPAPNPQRRQSELQSDTESFLGILRGWEPEDAEAWIHGRDATVWVRPESLVVAPRAPANDARLRLIPERVDRAEHIARFRAAEARCERNATQALPAHLPREWRR